MPTRVRPSDVGGHPPGKWIAQFYDALRQEWCDICAPVKTPREAIAKGSIWEIKNEPRKRRLSA